MARAKADPVCHCGYRKSVHPITFEGAGCQQMLGGFRESITFNEPIMTLGQTVDTPIGDL